MTEAYDGRQVVGMDLHRRRSVLVRMTGDGRKLETVRIENSPQALRAVLGRAGKNPRVVVEATYGWYWAVGVLEECRSVPSGESPGYIPTVPFRSISGACTPQCLQPVRGASQPLSACLSRSAMAWLMSLTVLRRAPPPVVGARSRWPRWRFPRIGQGETCCLPDGFMTFSCTAMARDLRVVATASPQGSG
jgi:hypothetical protein